MSWWLPAHVRRVIAILLLVLDLGLEPGSALSFVGIADPDQGEAVADLCRQDDFWWGKTCSSIGEAARPAENGLNTGDGSRRESATQFVSFESALHAAVIFNVESAIAAADVPLVAASSALGRLLVDTLSPHRNSYIAQKRTIVLIV